MPVNGLAPHDVEPAFERLQLRRRQRSNRPKACSIIRTFISNSLVILAFCADQKGMKSKAYFMIRLIIAVLFFVPSFADAAP